MESIIEGLLYVQGDLGLTIEDIKRILEIDEKEAKTLVLNLKEYYDNNNRGIRINFLGNTIKLTTREEHQKYYQALLEDPTSNTLSDAALETLAIIAYNEPITRGEVETLRGVDSAYIVRRLLAKGLIKECGKSPLPGKPTLYKTTDEFLDYFNLSSIEDLPDITFLEEEDKTRDLYTSIYKEGEELGRESSD